MSGWGASKIVEWGLGRRVDGVIGDGDDHRELHAEVRRRRHMCIRDGTGTDARGRFDWYYRRCDTRLLRWLGRFSRAALYGSMGRNAAAVYDYYFGELI